MIKIFLNGGPVMWPLLICSIITVATALERLFFIIRERTRRKPQLVEKILERVEHHDLDGAIKIGNDNRDFVARVLTFALAHRAESFSSAVLRAANLELKKFNRGLAVLDTIVTLAPLLGLLGTVTGMIHAFGLLGTQQLDAPEAITGGIAQALIATAFGLSIAITALIPFNYLNARLEEARHDIEDAATQLELHLEQCKECHKGELK
ncbi:MAG TPA: MotA/TolQ/ExbB proton channel family protein [Verrucomicrobiae bacterium]|jgi:biopolymer transport protein ExbB|nr:MotA/TolQ/ExbB proton channel family protein [Verrucomicrobiae bacterium]